MGNKNLHWEAITDVNAVLPANRLAYVQNENTGSSAFLSALRPFGAGVGNNSIQYYTHASSSDYQSLQALYNMRVRNSITFQAAYTYSKLLANSQRLDTPPFNVDAYNLRASWGPDILNHPHIFTANLVYVLPVLQGRNAFVRSTLGSWQASTIVSASSGPSISTLLNGGVQGLGDPAGVGIGDAASQDRPNRVAGQPCRTSGMDATQFINPSMFTVSGYQLGHVGNAGIGTCLGPGNTNVDFGVDKNFKITERIKAQFRFEFFNLVNHPSYSAPHNQTIGFNDTVYGDASGKVVPLTSATQILSATPAPGSNFGRTQSIRENGYRQLQYALKFTF